MSVLATFCSTLSEIPNLTSAQKDKTKKKRKNTEAETANEKEKVSQLEPFAGSLGSPISTGEELSTGSLGSISSGEELFMNEGKCNSGSPRKDHFSNVANWPAAGITPEMYGL